MKKEQEKHTRQRPNMAYKAWNLTILLLTEKVCQTLELEYKNIIRAWEQGVFLEYFAHLLFLLSTMSF